MEDLQLEAVSEYFEDAGLDNSNNPIWRCRQTGHMMLGNFLWFYRSLGAWDELRGVCVLGFPRSEEIGFFYYGGWVVVQVFDGGVLCYDPDHVLGVRPGKPLYFLIDIDAPILHEIAGLC